MAAAKRGKYRRVGFWRTAGGREVFGLKRRPHPDNRFYAAAQPTHTFGTDPDEALNRFRRWEARQTKSEISFQLGEIPPDGYVANYETNGRFTDCWKHSQTALPLKKWACMEWRFDSTADEMRFWLDGKELADLKVNQRGEGCLGQDLGGRWRAPKFSRMSFGWESYQNDGPQTVWIDDAAVDTKPIGCPTK